MVSKTPLSPESFVSISWGPTLETKPSVVLLRFGKALARLRTAHSRRVISKAKQQLRFAMNNYQKVKRNTRASARWTKFADLEPVFNFTS